MGKTLIFFCLLAGRNLRWLYLAVATSHVMSRACRNDRFRLWAFCFHNARARETCYFSSISFGADGQSFRFINFPKTRVVDTDGTSGCARPRECLIALSFLLFVLVVDIAIGQSWWVFGLPMRLKTVQQTDWLDTEKGDSVRTRRTGVPPAPIFARAKCLFLFFFSKFLFLYFCCVVS